MAWELMRCLDSELQYQASPTVNWIVRAWRETSGAVRRSRG